jgi:hypothetical protein
MATHSAAATLFGRPHREEIFFNENVENDSNGLKCWRWRGVGI